MVKRPTMRMLRHDSMRADVVEARYQRAIAEIADCYKKHEAQERSHDLTRRALQERAREVLALREELRVLRLFLSDEATRARTYGSTRIAQLFEEAARVE